jgi:F420-dependent oxidoreductase-like protein
MKFGFHAGQWSMRPEDGFAAAVSLAETAGFDSVWSSEAYGFDCLTPLAWWGATTSSVRLGTNILQMSARTPVATAMAAMSLDFLCHGRFVLGLGVSGPQVVEGWYGQPYPRPLARTREYVEIVRSVIRRDIPVEYEGKFFTLPYPGGTGLGRPLKSTAAPLRSEIPIMIGAEGPKNVALAAEIADGWLPLFLSLRADPYYRQALTEGFGRPGARHTLDTFEISPTISVILDDDVEVAADRLRPTIALYIGGMGAREANFHADVFKRLGYEGEVAEIQQHYLDGHKKDAIAAVPTVLIEEVALVGPAAKIREEVEMRADTVATSLIFQTAPNMLPAVVDALSGVNL